MGVYNPFLAWVTPRQRMEGAGGVNRDLAIIYSISEDKTESNERDENPFGRVSKDY